MTLIQNPALELSSFDELTMSTVAPTASNFNKLHFHRAKKPKKCKGGFRCVFRKLFCFHANLLHADRFSTHLSLYVDKNQKAVDSRDAKYKSATKKKIAEKKVQNQFQQQHQRMSLCNNENSTHIP